MMHFPSKSIENHVVDELDEDLDFDVLLEDE